MLFSQQLLLVFSLLPIIFTDHRTNLNAMTDMGTVYDQGLANRRVGATAMNSESSRSHSVFTCVIESRSKVPDPCSSFRKSRVWLLVIRLHGLT